MSEQVKFVLELTDETQRLIDEMNYPLEDKIKELNSEASFSREHLVVQNEPRTRDIVTVIAVSAGAAFILMRGIANLLKEIRGGGRTEIYDELVPLRDENGKIIFQEDGKTPIYVSEKKAIKVDAAYKTEKTDFQVLGGMYRLKEGNWNEKELEDKEEKQPEHN